MRKALWFILENEEEEGRPGRINGGDRKDY